MGSKIELDEQLTAFCFVRKDDSSSPIREKRDARSFLDELGHNIRRVFEVERFTVRDEFFVLGGASKVFIMSSPSLSSSVECIQSMNNCGSRLGESFDSSLGVFALNAFPAIKVRLESTEPRGILPGLLFVRVPNIVESIQHLSGEGILKDGVEVFIGFGAYSIIFYLRADRLTDIERNMSNIRNNLEGFWETRTILGVPREQLRDKEKELAVSEPYHRFSIMAKCKDRIECSVVDDIKEITNEERFYELFSNLRNGQDKITYRQGYMDLDIPCRSQTIGHVFDAACELRRRIKCIIDTVTMIRFEIFEGS